MRIILLIALVSLACGCSNIARVFIPKSRLLPQVSATAPKDNGTAPIIASSGEESNIALPAGSTITTTRTDAQPATATAPALPATEVREVRLSADSAITEKSQRASANGGTIDTSVALKKIDASEARWLLWASIACGIGGLVVKSMLPAWPGISNGLLAGAVLAFAAWKFAAVPPWAFAVAIGAVCLIALGYKRHEWDANGNNIPDILETKKTP